jgi:hypothetical protein
VRAGRKQVDHEDKSREELFIDPEEVVAFAQAYYATEFPNDGRRNCPPAGTFRESALSAALPDGPLRSHLFACSECFRSYRSARMSLRSENAPSRPRWAWLGAALAGLGSRRAAPATVAYLVVLSLAVVALLWYSRADSPSVTVNYSRQGEAPPAAVGTFDGGMASDVPGGERPMPPPPGTRLK